MVTKNGSLDPTKYPDEVFDLYSIPAYDRGAPDVVAGRAIGSSKQVVQPGDVLLSKIVPHIRRAWIVGRERGRRIIASGEWIVFRSGRAHAAYLRHVLVSDPFHARYMQTVSGVGGSLLRARPTLVARIEIPLPPLDEQRRIAEVLDRAEAMRAKRRAALALLRQLQQSIFLEIFGDPAGNPKGWPTQPLGLLLEGAEVFTDGDWVESKDQDPNGDVRLVQLADVGDGVYLDKSARYLTSDTARRLRCTFLQPGDLLVARMPDPLGRACLFPGDQRACVTVVDVCVIRPSKPGPDPVWLMNCLNTPGFRQQIARQATGTTRERISRGNLARLPIISPPVSTQLEFTRRTAALAGLRATAETSLGATDRLRASLQERAFSGHL